MRLAKHKWLVKPYWVAARLFVGWAKSYSFAHHDEARWTQKRRVRLAKMVGKKTLCPPYDERFLQIALMRLAKQ
jgi:hypothetical protein